VEVGVVIGENHAIFSVGDSTIYLRLLEGPFPNYRQVIPKDNDKNLVINRESLAGATKRMSIMASSLTHQIKFSVSGDQLALSVITPDVGEAQEMLGASYSGDALEIGYNANYILEALRHMEGEDVEFKFKEAVTAGLVTEAEPVEGEDYMCLVMPLRLSE
jgi:DNA polymerase-3 subunit beta